MNLASLLRSGRKPTVVGFDDGPFEKKERAIVPVCGVVCSGTRFEGMLWGQTIHDALNATEVVSRMLTGSKFASQAHVVLLDGITMGGMNVLDLPFLHQAVGVPVVAVMRRMPNIDKFKQVIQRIPNASERLRRLEAAGPLYQTENAVFQVIGESPEVISLLLPRLTDVGKVPECLRLAHLITSAVVTGVSGRRA